MKTITSNVLDDISKKIQGDSSNSGERAIVVFNGSNIRLDEKLEKIRRLKQNGIKISLAFSFMAEGILDTKKIVNYLSPQKVYTEEDMFKFNDIVDEHSILIAPNITINSLSKVCLGMVDSFISNMVWAFLYQGKKVYLDFDSIVNYLGGETSNKAVRSIIQGHINTIKDMGGIELIDEDYTIIGPIRDVSLAKDLQKDTLDKRLISEKDVINLDQNKSLVLPRGTIVTPLARDKAKEMNISIVIE